MADTLVRFARLVGDFSNPFYAEERQRDIWNEASAFGLQLVLRLGLSAAVVTIWVVGEPPAPYVLGALALLGVVCVLTVGYAERLDVVLRAPERLLRLRLPPYLLLVVALAAGLLRASGGTSTPVGVGLLLGAVAGLVGLAADMHRSRA